MWGTVLSPFEVAKLQGLDSVMLTNVGVLTYKMVPPTYGRVRGFVFFFVVVIMLLPQFAYV